MARLYVKKAKSPPKLTKQALREQHYYKKKPIMSVPYKFTITKDLVDYFIEECRQKQTNDREFWKNNITSDNYLKG